MKKEFYTAAVTTETNDIPVSDLIHYCGSWTWRAVEALAGAKDFVGDPKWIANRLNISVEAARDAVDGLLRIRLLKESADGLVAKSDTLIVGEDKLERSDIYQIHTKIRTQIQEKMTSRDAYANTVIRSNKAQINDFYRKFNILLDELSEKSSADKDATEVFGLELSLSRFTRER